MFPLSPSPVRPGVKRWKAFEQKFSSYRRPSTETERVRPPVDREPIEVRFPDFPTQGTEGEPVHLPADIRGVDFSGISVPTSPAVSRSRSPNVRTPMILGRKKKKTPVAGWKNQYSNHRPRQDADSLATPQESAASSATP